VYSKCIVTLVFLSFIDRLVEERNKYMYHIELQIYMQKLLGYALAFGAGISAAKVYQWTPVSSGHQHGEQPPGSKMTIKGIH
jgi:hypothetical protein